MEGLGVAVGKLLDDFQAMLFERGRQRLADSTTHVGTWDEFTEVFREGESRFVYAHWDGTTETEHAIKNATKATIRCLPLESDGPAAEPGNCIKTGQPSQRRVLFSKNY